MWRPAYFMPWSTRPSADWHKDAKLPAISCIWAARLPFFLNFSDSFDHVLGTSGVLPDNSLLFVALGAAFSDAGQCYELSALADKVSQYASSTSYASSEPLFASQEEYQAFQARHAHDSDHICTLESPAEDMFWALTPALRPSRPCWCDRNGHLFRPFTVPTAATPCPSSRNICSSFTPIIPRSTSRRPR